MALKKAERQARGEEIIAKPVGLGLGQYEQAFRNTILEGRGWRG